jgi:hypothetical protein
MDRLADLYTATATFLQNALGSLMSVVKVLVLSDFSVKLPPATRDRAALLGNGPSLAESLERDAAFLGTCELFCVNNFAQTEAYERLRPENVVFLDPYFSRFDGVASNHPVVRKTLDALQAKTTWPVTVYVPRPARRSAYWQQLTRHPHLTVVFFNYTIVAGFRWSRHWLYRQNWGMPQSQNVLVAVLFLALNRGFRELYLFGADHSWHEQLRVADDNRLLLRDDHFYEQTGPSVAIHDPKNRRESGIRLQFQSLAKAFFGYEVLAEYARQRGQRVRNASVKSYIDVFERVRVGEKETLNIEQGTSNVELKNYFS